MPILRGDGAKGHEAIYGWEKQTAIEQVPLPLPPTPKALAGASRKPWNRCWGGDHPVAWGSQREECESFDPGFGCGATPTP